MGTKGQFAGRTVFITGASAGIGEACARAFAAEGATLVLAARRRERLESLAFTLRGAHRTECHLMALDVRNRAAVDAAVAAIPERFATIDLLVNNAGLARGFDKLQDGQPDDWDEMIDTNVKGLLWVTRAVLPGMLARARGHILNIGSVAGHEVYPRGNVYCATKFAVDALTKGIRMDLVDTNIRVTTIDPGLTETEFSVVRFHGDAEKAKAPYRGIRPLTGEDVSRAVLWAAAQPEHLHIHSIVLAPAHQASVHVVHRRD